MSLQPQPSHTSLSSVTSLSRYASAKSPSIDPYNGNPSRDFCNSFWGGDGDAGVNVLFARMRGGVRTIEGLKGFWKERAAIEEDYAKRMGELAGVDLGRDEIGELRNSLTTLQLETTKLAQTHLQLANQIRSEMEDPAAAMLNKLSDHKRLVMSAVEKRHKAKLQAEVYVAKAREKYYGDCVRIGVCRQQLQQLQENPNSGDLDKVRSKLKRLEQTVAANEKDYAAFTKSLADSLPAWESEWRSFCDGCQDLEEERLDFMKDNLWAYANSVSTVCVADDEPFVQFSTNLKQTAISSRLYRNTVQEAQYLTRQNSYHSPRRLWIHPLILLPHNSLRRYLPTQPRSAENHEKAVFLQQHPHMWLLRLALLPTLPLIQRLTQVLPHLL
ncbi:uncharacterized protein C8R40DRAFT_512092 [Lentinula edodes]|uniref:uncharacterized protein n=1 Tax=Lentinula edodes TaxID=5353 RepID=UPI001E8EADB0|nr:uncharacterized protein C8R40DRAFT_512092 [Lentinula edodes]KAH7871905.1 hypothetical protein C8R40DRAFT_512092 [Lentinula edodes]